jgi:hypothetical protein
MKKFFIVLGSIFLAIIELGAIGIAFVAVRGNALDKESKAYADSAIPAIVTTWSEKELLDRASPEFKQAVTIGQLQKSEPAQGHAVMSATTQTGKMISAQYSAKATFQKGEAMIKLGLIKHGDQWQILNFMSIRPPLFHRKRSNQSWNTSFD